MRLQKIIADRGLASRREAERWIEEGRISVNGETATIGMQADPEVDDVRIDDRPIPRKPSARIVLAMNKPRGITCTNYDPHGGQTVFDLLPPDFKKKKLFCVGRLDKDSEGLVLLTNDGELNQTLAHPSYNVSKRYIARLNKPLKQEDRNKLVNGITWEGERLKVEKIITRKPRGTQEDNTVEIHMRHGKKREIRRLLYAFGYNVKRLRRSHIGPISVKGIPKGSFKSLSNRDLAFLER